MAVNHPMKYDSRWVKSADGTEIYTDAAGNRSPGSPVIVLIHGFSMVKAVFDPIFEDPKWTSQAFLVRYDARGHGRSGKPLTDEAWKSKRMWEDFKAVCEEFQIEKTYILGWSLGSAHFVDIITYNTSITVLGLINVQGAIYLDSSFAKRTVNYENFKVILTLANPPTIDIFQETVFAFLHTCSDKLSPELFRILLEGVIQQPRAIAARLNSRTHNPEKMLREAREGKLELLVVSAGKDKLLNVEGFKAVFDELGWKKWTYEHLEDADHIPWVSCPEAFREIVIPWVRERYR
ncbi:alpha/beta-hydrolase [Macrolepiota fuliginosa MF-IS2]|uniref:Alpha/beta-hydrolase n=1 Tax=Macrolepiota fuliginosa MF-IS2 TaxID=1400762 RepID=A0A9P5XFD9_9AGAR|nr:alpha/beta-hydrolase [Macrolepiota fuliginosa MF-IS2]